MTALKRHAEGDGIIDELGALDRVGGQRGLHPGHQGGQHVGRGFKRHARRGRGAALAHHPRAGAGVAVEHAGDAEEAEEVVEVAWGSMRPA